MRTWIKRTLIALAALFGLIVVAAFGAYWYFFGFGERFPSGGELHPLQAVYDVSYYDITLDVDAENKTIAGNSRIRARALNDLETIRLNLVDELKVERVEVNGSAAAFSHRDMVLSVEPDEELGGGRLFDVTVYYSGKPPEARFPPWQGGFSWEKDSAGKHWVAISCQGEGAKIWFPCKDHPSDEPDSVALNITVPNPYFVAATGLLQGVDSSRSKLTYHWKTYYPVNNYNINWSMGMYKKVSREYVSADGPDFPLVFYVLEEGLPGAHTLLDEAAEMLQSLSGYFGPYPWAKEKMGLLYTPFLGMEHQTLIAYGNEYQQKTTAGIVYDDLLLHELAHEWWGNKVTVGDWADFWLHEGFASYSEALYLRDIGGEEAYHARLSQQKRMIRHRNPLVPGENMTTEQAYNSDIYYKGSAVLHVLRFVTGDSAFFDAIYTFASDHAYSYPNTVDTEDFLKLINATSGMDLSNLFDLYVYSTDVPVIEVKKVQDGYAVRLTNLDFELPYEIEAGGITKRYLLGKETIFFKTDSMPEVDPQRWYMSVVKRVEEKS